MTEVLSAINELRDDIANLAMEVRRLHASGNTIENGNIDPDGMYQVYANPDKPIESILTVYKGIVTASSSPVLRWAVEKKKSWKEVKEWLEGKGGFRYKPA